MQKIIILLAIFFFLAHPVQGAQSYGILYVQKINSVYDGDTFRADIADIHPLLGKNIAIRVYGVDTPEIRSKDPSQKRAAYKARDFVRMVLKDAESVELRNIKRGKYFRIVANVYVDGLSLRKMILVKKLGVPYFGGKKGAGNKRP